MFCSDSGLGLRGVALGENASAFYETDTAAGSFDSVRLRLTSLMMTGLGRG